MSTKNQQTSQNYYDPTSMNAFTGMTGALSPAIQNYINNPFSNPFFQTQQQMGMNTANQMGQSSMSNLTRNLVGSGISQNSPAALEMMNNQARANSGTRANLGFLSPVNNALQMQQSAMNTAAGYRPLQTGGQQTQTQSGLGTWLPQIAGMGLSLATGGMSGMMGGAMGGAMSGTMGAMNAALRPMQSPFFGPGGNMPVNGSYGLGMNAPDVGGYNFGPSPFGVN